MEICSFFFFSSRRRHTRFDCDWSSDVCSSDLTYAQRVFALTPDDTASWERALVAGEKALRLRPDLAEAHYARAYVLWGPPYRFPHVLAIQENRRALPLNPSLEDAHHQPGRVSNPIGFLDDAIAEFQQALALDPTDLLAEERIGVALVRSEEHTSELQSQSNLVCRLLLEKKKR